MRNRYKIIIFISVLVGVVAMLLYPPIERDYYHVSARVTYLGDLIQTDTILLEIRSPGPPAGMFMTWDYEEITLGLNMTVNGTYTFSHLMAAEPEVRFNIQNQTMSHGWFKVGFGEPVHEELDAYVLEAWVEYDHSVTDYIYPMVMKEIWRWSKE